MSGSTRDYEARLIARLLLSETRRMLAQGSRAFATDAGELLALAQTFDLAMTWLRELEGPGDGQETAGEGDEAAFPGEVGGDRGRG